MNHKKGDGGGEGVETKKTTTIKNQAKEGD